MRQHPHLYELNARIFVRRLSEKYGRAVTLAGAPEEEWQQLARRGFDIVWPMGVWKRSPGARQKALHHPTLRHEYQRALPDWTEKNVDGSPYAVYSYSLDPSLGAPGDLARLKSRLNGTGLRLMVDFVPNHLALDHPWTVSHPSRFVQAKESDVHTHPHWFYPTTNDVYLAHGKDPYFPPWTDTAQVNFYSTDLREAFTGELLKIAEVADGVRCDMAMLALNDVFGQVWGEIVKGYPRPETEFWAEAIGGVRQRWPDFVFLAEVYWGLEQKLQQVGFDFTYDKGRYDLLRFSTPSDIRSYLITKADDVYQRRSARFIENHDEPRAVTAFGRERSLAAAVVLATLPGLRLFHDGQLEGQRIRLPIQLVREPEEVTDPEIMKFYDRLLAVCNAPAFHEGAWRLLEATEAWTCNESHHSLLAWCWRYREQFKIVVVNYSASPAQGRLKFPLPSTAAERVMFHDELTGATYERDPNEVSSLGLYVDLAPYHSHILDMTLV